MSYADHPPKQSLGRLAGPYCMSWRRIHPRSRRSRSRLVSMRFCTPSGISTRAQHAQHTSGSTSSSIPSPAAHVRHSRCGYARRTTRSTFGMARNHFTVTLEFSTLDGKIAAAAAATRPTQQKTRHQSPSCHQLHGSEGPTGATAIGISVRRSMLPRIRHDVVPDDTPNTWTHPHIRHRIASWSESRLTYSEYFVPTHPARATDGQH